MRASPVALAIVAAILCGQGPAANAGGGTALQMRTGGTVRGRVELPDGGPAARRPAVSRLGGDRHDDPQQDARDRRMSVVYLERAPRRAFGEPDERRARIDQRNERFVPHVVAVTVGSIVDFPNNDNTYHNVFSLSEAKSFDLGRYAAGRSKSVRFDRPGIVRVFCDIHSHMSAFVLVFAHRFFAVTDEEGRYQLDNVPPGTYTVVLWNEAIDPVSRPVTVPESGDVELNFVLERPRSTQ